jgi:predicted NAD/FAD-dependent oxidoreductase
VKPQHIAVVGAGIAGASCARRLAAAGKRVTLFDKARGAGGRMSTKRVETPLGTARFDHGAQYVTSRDDEFGAQLSDWMRVGAADHWTGRFAEIDRTGRVRDRTAIRWVGAPGMNAIVKAALDGLDARFDARVIGFDGGPGAWRLVFEEGPELGFYDAVVVAVPAEQAGPLLGRHAPLLAKAAELARTAPCWAVMAAFDDEVKARFDAAKVYGGPLAWLARNNSKPRRDELETWVLHADPEWSREHLERPPEEIVWRLIDEMHRHVRSMPKPVWTGAHRWRYAQVEKAAGSPYGWEKDKQIGVCGDWLLGPRVEYAWASGVAMADALLDRETAEPAE